MKKRILLLKIGICMMLLWSRFALAALPPEEEKLKYNELKEKAKKLQEQAPEVVIVEVVDYEIEHPKEDELYTKRFCVQKIALISEIIKVRRTKSGLKEEDTIHIEYERKMTMLPGPMIYNNPIIYPGQKIIAYLTHKKDNVYVIAADFISLMDFSE